MNSEIPKPCLFFFSYAKNNDSPYLRQFFEDLCSYVKDRIRWDGKISFIDRSDIPLGVTWEEYLRQMLQTSKVLVSIFAPPYFQSASCGREWQVFQMRREKYVAEKRAAGDTLAIRPAVIKPVIWLPLKSLPPGSVRDVQYAFGTADDAHNMYGLDVMSRQIPNKFQSEYVDFMSRLADQIVEASKVKLPPAELDEYPTFDSIPNAFEADIPNVVPPPSPDLSNRPELVMTEPRSLGPNVVQFVFVAGSPADFLKEALMDEAQKPYFRKQIESYLENGGREWKPFFPDVPIRIRPMVTSVASGNGLNLDCEYLDCDRSLADNIREANRRRNLVIVLADSWTLGLPKYRHLLEGFDERAYRNCSVLVSWNERDPELADLSPAERAAFEAKLEIYVKKTFPNMSSVLKPLHFCYSIRTPDQLNSKLFETLKALRESFINETMNNPDLDIGRPVESSILKPSISAKPSKDAASN